ncbi:MAG: ATP-binding cassette domain-containing protein [Chloroflexi bacterium]|nr:ATP-binding cassette domain-containing protein [Chloroflexota bacterium]
MAQNPALSSPSIRTRAGIPVRSSIARGFALVVVILMVNVAVAFVRVGSDDPLLSESTFGQLAAWMAGQSEEEAPESIFGALAKSWASARGEEVLDEAAAVDAMRWPVVLIAGAASLYAFVGSVFLRAGRFGSIWLMLSMHHSMSLLFLIPAIDGDITLTFSIVSVFLTVLAVGLSSRHIGRVVGFLLALSVLLAGVEALKGFARANDYAITVAVPGWTATVYDTPDAAFAALQAGELDAVFGESGPLGEAGAGVDGVSVLTTLSRDESRIGLPVKPIMPGRLAVAVRNEDAATASAAAEFVGRPVGTIAGDPAVEFLNAPRSWVLLDLKIFNDLNLPHLQSIAVAFFQPARRNGPVLLMRILAGNALYTWSEAALRFAFATLGFVLGALFAHFRLLERGLLPYVVASQTVPILAIAPMVVIWLGAGPASVAVIAAYLTFFPVTINTLRGLTSPKATQVELMRSYAASRWTIFLKLRLPSAVPYIFTALKVSATASVVGAIIGELPSSIRDGLARAILDFSSSYSEAHRDGRVGRNRILRDCQPCRTRRPAALYSTLRKAMTETPAVIRAQGVNKIFAVKNADPVVALKDIQLDVKRGEFVSLIGPSGCGKSTLLRLIADLLQPSSGELVINGKTPHQARLDRDYGMVFQAATLYDWRTVGKNVQLPLEIMGIDKPERESAPPKCSNWSNWASSRSITRGSFQAACSGVAIARALAFQPALLLMDEPFGALDEFTRERMNLELLRIWQATQTTVIFVTHSIAEAVFLSSRVVVMSPRPGRITAVLDVDLPYPRTFETREQPRYFELVTEVRELLRDAHTFDE